MLPGVVIAVYNEANTLQRNLPSLVSQFKEIIIVDNHSEDNSVEICRDFPVKLVQPPHRFSRGQCWNLGARHITSDNILFLHIDTCIPAETLKHGQRLWKDSHWDYSCFRIRFGEHSLKFRLLEMISNFRSRKLKIIYGDQGLCVRKTIFQKIDGFPNVYLLEDLKINRYLRPYRFHYIDSPIHPSARKFQQIGFYRYLWLMNKILFLNWIGIETKTIYRLYYKK